MKKLSTLFLTTLIAQATLCDARGPRPEELGASPLPIGAEGVVWYSTWDTALAEAKRSNRPIFFMAAAHQCGSVSGTFWPGYMGTEISLFSQERFIQASKKYVCVRLGTYESKKHQDMIRDLLRGTMQNTAFVVFAPDGKTKLTRSGRSPNHAFGRDVLGEMAKLSNKYKPKNTLEDATLTDYHSFQQSLNAASADQRLLVWTVASKANQPKVLTTIQKVFNDKDVSGRYFYDTAGKDDTKWANDIKGVTQKSGIFIIRSGQFGLSGTVMKELPLNASEDTIKAALETANAEFANTEKRKVYSEHVKAGKKEGIDYENTIAPGEDRDGDGKIDPKPERGGRRGGPPRR